MSEKSSCHIQYDQYEKSYHRIVASLVAEYCQQDAKILDIGCGLGYTLKRVAEKLPKAILSAADIDEHCLHATREKVALSEVIQLERIEDLFEKAGQYDAVIMSHVLEHTIRPADTIEGIYKVLTPGGILVLAVPNPVRPDVFLSALLRRHYVNRGHAYAWDRSHWMNFLENIMNVNVVCYSQDFAWLPNTKRFNWLVRLGEFLSHYFPWLSFSNIAVIRKDKE